MTCTLLLALILAPAPQSTPASVSPRTARRAYLRRTATCVGMQRAVCAPTSIAMAVRTKHFSVETQDVFTSGSFDPRLRSRRSWTLPPMRAFKRQSRSEEHTSELQSQSNLVCRLLLE